MEKFLLTIEFRYDDAPKYKEDRSPQYITKTITIGVFDTRDEANISGNKALEIFESKFKLNPHYNRKERFSNNGGGFGSPKDLICDGTWVMTPFSLFAKIEKLKYGDVEQTIDEAVGACKRYLDFKREEKD